MKKILLIGLIAITVITSAYSRNYISISVAPYFDGGNILWTGGENTGKEYSEFGAEINLDVGLYANLGSFLYGIQFGLGAAFPMMREMPEGEYLYDYAITPYVATAIGIEFNEDWMLDLSVGYAMQYGWINAKDEGHSIKGITFDFMDMFASLSLLYSFNTHLALRAGISATLNPFFPLAYSWHDERDPSHTGGAGGGVMLYHVEPFIGAAFTF